MGLNGKAARNTRDKCSPFSLQCFARKQLSLFSFLQKWSWSKMLKCAPEFHARESREHLNSVQNNVTGELWCSSLNGRWQGATKQCIFLSSRANIYTIGNTDGLNSALKMEMTWKLCVAFRQKVPLMHRCPKFNAIQILARQNIKAQSEHLHKFIVSPNTTCCVVSVWILVGMKLLAKYYLHSTVSTWMYWWYRRCFYVLSNICPSDTTYQVKRLHAELFHPLALN